MPQPEGAGWPGATGGRELPVAPELVSAALPYLLLAGCPLSMPAKVLMMDGMQGEGGEAHQQGSRRRDDTHCPTRDERTGGSWDRQAVSADRIGASEREEPHAAKGGTGL